MLNHPVTNALQFVEVMLNFIRFVLQPWQSHISSASWSALSCFLGDSLSESSDQRLRAQNWLGLLFRILVLSNLFDPGYRSHFARKK